MNNEFSININGSIIISSVTEKVKDEFKKWIDNFSHHDTFTFMSEKNNSEIIIYKPNILSVHITKQENMKMSLDDLVNNVNVTIENTNFVNEFSEAIKNEEFTELPGNIVGDPNESKEVFLEKFKNVIEQIEGQKK